MKAPMLRSARLVFKPVDMTFLSEDYVAWMNDEEVNRFLESGGDYTIEKLEEYLRSVEKRDQLFWAITIDGEKHIGNIKIDPVDLKNKIGEYGITMGDRSEWRKGYSYEASQRVIDYCFSEAFNLRKIMLGVVEDNVAAVKLYEKLGFEIEGIYKKHTYKLGKWCNSYRMALFNPRLNIL